jgi:hypothetical protein
MILLTFRVLYFESFDFTSSSLIVVSSSVLDTLSNFVCHLFVSFSKFTLSEENLAIASLSKYNTRNVNKRQKRLENKFLTTLTEIQELKNQCEQKDNEINLSSMPLFNDTFSFLTSLTTSCMDFITPTSTFNEPDEVALPHPPIE